MFIPFKKNNSEIKNLFGKIFKFKSVLNNQAKVAEVLNKKYIIPYLNSELPKWDIKPKKDLGTDKIIWQFWGSGVNENTPDIVVTCLNSVEKYKGDYQVILLDINTIQDYVDLPDFIYDKLKNNEDFTYAFFSDLLRVYLLSAYGGVWLDATILLTDKIPNNLLNKDFFMYQRDKKPKDYKFWERYNNNYFSWHKDFKVRCLNSFIIAKKNNRLISAVKDILINYWQSECSFKHYFLFQILFNELVRQKEFKNDNCEVINDVAPHILQAHIHFPFSQKYRSYVISSSFIHKLTYFDKLVTDSMQDYIIKSSICPCEIAPRRDYNEITFCSMCFNLGKNKISRIKNVSRKYDEFYLKSLKKLALRYKHLVLWCDEETASFIKANNFVNVKTKVMKFEELPRFQSRDKYLNYLKKMKENSFNQGYLLKNLEPEEIVDYLILVLSKIDVVKWAKDNDFFGSEYFYWVDAGIHNEAYIRCWQNWDGEIAVNTNNFKGTFITEHRKMYRSLVELSSIEDIALIKAPFEIPASVFVLNKNIIDRFYNEYNKAIEYLNNMNLISTEQSVFSVMLKLGNGNLFEMSKTNNYIDIINLVAKSDNIQQFENDFWVLLIKRILLNFIKIFNNKTVENVVRQKIIYKEIRVPKVLRRFVSSYIKRN